MVCLTDRDVLCFRVWFPLILCNDAGYQKKAVFLEPVVKTCQKGTLDQVFIPSNFYAFEVYIVFTDIDLV